MADLHLVSDEEVPSLEPAHGHSFVTVGEYEGCAACQICDGFEGSIPTHCPGRKMSLPESQRIYAGTLDFVDGEWTSIRKKGLIIRMHPYFIGSWLFDGRRDGHALQMDPIPLTAVDRWESAT